jgi:hypothetical protein
MQTKLKLWVCLFVFGFCATAFAQADLATKLDSTIIYSKKNEGRFIRMYMVDESHLQIESCQFDSQHIECRGLGRGIGYTAEEVNFLASKAKWRAIETGAAKSLLYGAPIVTLAPAALGVGIKFYIGAFIVRYIGRLVIAAPLAKGTGLVGSYVAGAAVLAADKSIPVYMSVINFVGTYLTKLPGEWKEAWTEQKESVRSPWQASKILNSHPVLAIEFKGDLNRFEQELVTLFKTEIPKLNQPTVPMLSVVNAPIRAQR